MTRPFTERAADGEPLRSPPQLHQCLRGTGFETIGDGARHGQITAEIDLGCARQYYRDEVSSQERPFQGGPIVTAGRAPSAALLVNPREQGVSCQKSFAGGYRS